MVIGHIRPSSEACHPRSTVQQPAAGFGSRAADLLEEQRDILLEAAIADVSHPVEIHGPRLGAALATDDDPVDAGEVEARERPNRGSQDRNLVTALERRR